MTPARASEILAKLPPVQAARHVRDLPLEVRHWVPLGDGEIASVRDVYRVVRLYPDGTVDVECIRTAVLRGAIHSVAITGKIVT
jgi:hypothetical protein